MRPTSAPSIAAAIGASTPQPAPRPPTSVYAGGSSRRSVRFSASGVARLRVSCGRSSVLSWRILKKLPSDQPASANWKPTNTPSIVESGPVAASATSARKREAV